MPIEERNGIEHAVLSTANITASRFNPAKWSKMAQVMANCSLFVEVVEAVWP